MTDPAAGRSALARWGSTAGLVLLLVVLMLWLAGAFRAKVPAGPTGPDPAPPAGPRRAVVARVELPDAVEQIGTVRARLRAEVASKLLAQVLEVRVEAGDRVVGASPTTSATVVAVLDARDVRAQLARAEAQARAGARGIEVQEAEVRAVRAAAAAARARVDKAEADFRRYEELVARGVAPPETLDQVRSARDVAVADQAAAESRVEAARQQLARAGEELLVAERQVDEARVLLDYATLVSPFGGVVVERLVEPGDTVRPGQGVVRVEDPARLELHAAVAESLAARLSLGQRLVVRVDALAATLEGTVREVAPSADPASRTLSVKVALPATAGLVSGLSGRLQVPVGARSALVVPQAAVRRVGQLELVDVVEGGAARRRFVTTAGPVGADGVEVASGLEAGEEVALP